MTGAMAGFAVEDLLLKLASRTLPVGQILILFGAAGMVAFTLLARARGDRLISPAMLSRPILLRAAFEVTGRLFHTLALAAVPLALVSTLLQATPLVVVAGAALIFGERVGWRRWTAIGVGFAGVLVVLRPGTAGFDAAAMLAVLGMIGFAGRDLATRAAPPVLSTLTLGVYGFAMMVPAGLIVLAATGTAPVVPDPAAGAAMAGATAVGVAAYYALTRAMRTGEVSVVTPFRYTRLVFGVGLAALLLGEGIDAATVAGSLMIVGPGLYTLWRSRRA